MYFTLIVCTYKRSQPLHNLLLSVQKQTLYPNEILIIDGSSDTATELMLSKNRFENLQYFRVSPSDRGLTKQRNYGIDRVCVESEIVCFLDDDTALENDYFEQLLHTYKLYPEALGVGGYITNEIKWFFEGENYLPTINEFYFDGWKRTDGKRFIWRKKLGLDTNCPPAYLPEFSHGRSVGFLPPSGKIYPVEQFMGGVSSFRKSIFKEFKFSSYFEGYGLYEDADFTLRLSMTGKLYVNTSAKLGHFHDASGRPNSFKYGKMVVRNGYYVWRVKYPKPPIQAKVKWNLITLLLTLIRFSNTFTASKKREAFMESLGRTMGWFSLFFSKPNKS